MSTKVRSELSKRNEYRISKHRYLELKHFCMQYDEWKEALRLLTPLKSSFKEERIDNGRNPDPTAELTDMALYFRRRIGMLEKIAAECLGQYGVYLLDGIVNEETYDTIRARHCIPFCRDTWYTAYRRFFWLLDKERG